MIANRPDNPKPTNPAEWLERAIDHTTDFFILTKKGGAESRIAFFPKPCQQDIAKAMLKQAEANLPIRLLVLKGRQVGASTFLVALGYSLCDLNVDWRAFFCAQDDEATQVLHGKCDLIHKTLPNAKPTLYCSRKEFNFALPHNSHLKFQTAGKLTLGRSDTFQYLHMSELPQWREQQQTLSSVQQCVAYEPRTIIVKEATAKGVDEEFHRAWVVAYERYLADPNDLNGYLPVFISWLDEDDCAMPAPKDYDWGHLDKWELDLRQRGATLEQLYWRRRKIADDLNGDPELFAQEYPSYPDEAFRTSGRRAIPEIITREHRRTARVGRRVRLKWNTLVPGGVEAVEGPYTDRYWEIWQTPEDDHDYTVGGDVMEGEASDQNNASSDPDFSAGFVLNRVTMEQVAAWHGRIDPDMFGAELCKAGHYYNKAWLSPEINACGLATLLVIRRANYPHIYQRQRPEEGVIEGQEAPTLGWRTTTGTRDQMIDDWLMHTRPDQFAGFEGQVVVRSGRLVAEEESFIYKKSGKREHRAGGHDDMLFAGMIALQLHRRCPRTRTLRYQEYVRRVAFDPRELLRTNAVMPSLEELDAVGAENEVTG